MTKRPPPHCASWSPDAPSKTTTVGAAMQSVGKGSLHCRPARWNTNTRPRESTPDADRLPQRVAFGQDRPAVDDLVGHGSVAWNAAAWKEDPLRMRATITGTRMLQDRRLV